MCQVPSTLRCFGREQHHSEVARGEESVPHCYQARRTHWSLAVRPDVHGSFPLRLGHDGQAQA
jgi:hypothetical protein